MHVLALHLLSSVSSLHIQTAGSKAPLSRELDRPRLGTTADARPPWREMSVASGAALLVQANPALAYSNDLGLMVDIPGVGDVPTPLLLVLGLVAVGSLLVLAAPPPASRKLTSQDEAATKRAPPPTMMASKKDPDKREFGGLKNLQSKPGDKTYYFTWTVTLGIYALMFAGIAKKAAEGSS